LLEGAVRVPTTSHGLKELNHAIHGHWRGAMLPRAPQFFTMPPETEDKATVEKVRAVAREIGAKLKAMIIFSNDHAEQFFLNVAPPFTIPFLARMHIQRIRQS
jgi:hypothetical protein